MQIIRTIVWVLLLVGLLIFSALNWKPVEIKIWEGLVLETKIPALVIASFLLGLAPMWLLHRAQKFYLARRITSLESAARTVITTPVAAAPEAPAPEATPEAATEAEASDDLKPEER